MRRFPRAWLFLAALTLSLPGCRISVSPQQQGTGATLDGVVELVDPGSCWTIRVNPTVRYLPINLPSQFRHDSMLVRIEISPRDDISTTCQVDHVVQLLSIQAR